MAHPLVVSENSPVQSQPRREETKVHPQEHRKVLAEADAAGDSLITYVAIPRYLYWKFRTRGRRYFAKFSDEVHPSAGSLRESCKKHAENIKNIFEQTQGQHKCLRELLQESLCDSDECTLFKCEARLGKVVWRYQDGNRLQDLLKSPKGSEFYTRATTKPEGLLLRFQHLSAMDKTISQPNPEVAATTCHTGATTKDTRPLAAVSDLVGGFHGLDLDEKKVMLSVKDIDNDCAYKLVLKETSGRDFIIDSDVDESDVKWTLKADFLCFGRSHDLRIACQCRKPGGQNVPSHVKKSFEEITRNIKRNIRGRLEMKLRHGRVLVETVRQSQRRTYTSAVGHEFRLTQLKESNLRFQASTHSYFVPIPEDQDKHGTFITPDVRYEILHTDYQEVEVSMAKKLHEMGGIDGILEEVRSVINDGMDIVDMAEECLDEPYAH